MSDPQLKHIDAPAPKDVPPSTLFEILANDRRRYALRYLMHRFGAIELEDLAAQIAYWERESEEDSTDIDDHQDRIVLALVHSHLPKMDEAGIVWFDSDQRVVGLHENATAVRPHLEISADVDF